MRWVLLTLALTACGGGSSQTAPVVRHDLLYGYFNVNDMVQEVSGHTNLLVEHGWPTGTSQAVTQHLMQAKASGVNTVILDLWPDADGMRYQFEQLRAANVLGMVKALYRDEPTGSAEDIRVITVMVRKVASEFAELDGVVLAAVFKCDVLVGIEYYDWVGCDNYGGGPQRVPLTAKQRLLILPGGAFGELPQSFVSFADNNPEVVAVIPFLWVWPDGHCCGIRDNSTRQAYIDAGNTLVH